MFNKQKFSEIFKKIYNSYDNQRNFASSTGVNRAYISQYMNCKLSNPPTPKILKKIADGSKGLTTYEELMEVCGYISSTNTEQLIATKCFNDNLFLLEKYHLGQDDTDYLEKILVERNEHDSNIASQINHFVECVDITSFDLDVDRITLFDTLIKIDDNIKCHIINSRNATFAIDNKYFEFITEDDALFPLADVGDKALVFKQDKIDDVLTPEKGTYLIKLDNKNTIRKIELSKDEKYYTLTAMNPCYKITNISKDELYSKIQIIGKVVKSENQSAFKQR